MRLGSGSSNSRPDRRRSRVVRGVCAERRQASCAPRLRATTPPSRSHFLQHRPVLLRRGDDGHVRVVLRGGADHRRAADVDVLDRLRQRDPARATVASNGYRFTHDQVDRRDPVRAERLHVRRQRRGPPGCAPCTAGCSVFTRPSIISGKPVTCSTGVTGDAVPASSAAPSRRSRGSPRPAPRARARTPPRPSCPKR